MTEIIYNNIAAQDISTCVCVCVCVRARACVCVGLYKKNKEQKDNNCKIMQEREMERIST